MRWAPPLAAIMWVAAAAGAKAPASGVTHKAAPPMQRAWAAVRNLEPGQALSPGDVAEVWRPAKLLPARALASAPQPASVAWRPIAAGNVLCEKDVGPGPWRLAGSKVRVRFEIGALRLEDDAILLQGAASGMAVHVQAAHGSRALQGRLDEGGTVVVED